MFTYCYFMFYKRLTRYKNIENIRHEKFKITRHVLIYVYK